MKLEDSNLMICLWIKQDEYGNDDRSTYPIVLPPASLVLPLYDRCLLCPGRLDAHPNSCERKDDR